MKNKLNSEFEILLNSFSSILSFRILTLLNNDKNGITLTQTANELNESISTIQDYLKKLLKSGLLHKEDKKYIISIFGRYFLTELQRFKTINKLAPIFGKIPAEMIPSEFIQELLPHIESLEIQENSWLFITQLNELFSQFIKDLEKGDKTQHFKLVGWWSLELDLQMLESQIKDFSLNHESFNKIFNNENFQFKFISHKSIVNEILENEKIRTLLNEFVFNNNVRVCNACFNFTMVKINDVIGIFLVKDDDIDIKHYIFVKNNPGMERFFERVFNYYWEQGTPLKQFLNKT